MWINSLKTEDTFEFGKKLGKDAKAGDIYLLDGEMGVGKTVFAQGFASGLGIKEPINSPTFTILQEYDTGRLPLYHFDVYRVEAVEEMEEIGYESYFFGQGVCLIEWAKKIEEIIPSYAKEISMAKDLTKGFDYRMIYYEDIRN